MHQAQFQAAVMHWTGKDLCFCGDSPLGGRAGDIFHGVVGGGEAVRKTAEPGRTFRRAGGQGVAATARGGQGEA